MSKRLGFIGCGNMAKAIIGGIINAKMAAPADIVASDVYRPGLEAAQKEFGIKTSSDNSEIVDASDVIFLAVKPQVLPDVLQQISPNVTHEKLVVSIAAGQTIAALEKGLGKTAKIVRLMPNTPALANAGMTGACRNALVADAEMDFVIGLLTGFGRAEVVPEKLMDVVTGVSGSGPAYVFLFIEALADAGVLEGLPRAQAYTFAAQTVLGSAKMVLDTAKHPGVLKDMVCSPAGTTIEAVASLERHGLRSAVIEAVRTATNRSRSLGG